MKRYTIANNGIHNLTTETISFGATEDQLKLIDELIRNLLRNIEQR